MPANTQHDPTEITMNEIGNSNPAFANRAVAACCKAWKRVYSEAFAVDQCDWKAARAAGEAYRAAMPPLSSRDNCVDFIACVTHGMLIGAIHENNGTKLLYAAQVAVTAAASAEKAREAAGYAVYATLTAREAEHVKKFAPPRSSRQ
jgi:hypothetical protein